MNWDDLRIARAVYEAGSYAAAGQKLRVNETTVSRRLSRLERALGVTLFEAVEGERRPTASCEELVALTAVMAQQAERIVALEERADALVGRRRIATTDSIAAGVLAPRVAALLSAHPGLSMDFLVSTENVNFSRWEADIAIRLSRPEKGDFTISKLGAIRFYLFEPLQGADLICAYPQELDRTPEARHLAELGLQQKARCTTKNLIVIKRLVEEGSFCGILPNFLCAELLADPRYRVSELKEQRTVWLLLQPHLKHDVATRAVVDWIRNCFKVIDGQPEGAG